ncbi:hypothetical protein V9T40_002497 [Parthenolecanium corni]|uniref:CCA tRNA nucleotidyltransferase 1, mitochondrial n=1 Tax=Parthenolecanium corni TaxID=536013 RepID=A0AAN9Y499_9HEMI
MKLDTPEFHSIFTPELRKLALIFNRHGHEIRIVGGAVRDLLDGKKPSDLDFATSATPDQMKEMFEAESIRMINNKGEKHGTITPRINDKENFEVTTLRTDVSTDGRHAEVEFTTDWKIDSARRDLTINSMYLGLDGVLYDYFDGYEDLKKKRVVFVGNPDARIKEDYLRILRYFRFYGRIAPSPDSHDKSTLKAIADNAAGLSQISGERIWSELSRILVGNYAKDIIETMLSLGLGPHIGLNHTEFLDIECFEKICELSAKYTFKPITFITSLFRSEDEVLNFHSRVKLSSFDRDLALFLIYHKCDGTEGKPPVNRLKPYQYLLICTKLPKELMREYIIELLKFKDEEQLIKQFQSWTLPTIPINGHDVKSAGVKNNKEIGTILEALTALWVESDFQLSKEELLQKLPGILSQLQRNKA